MIFFRIINGKDLTNKDGVQISKDINNNTYTLIIPKLNPSVHDGIITIKATNPIGTIQHDIHLNILGYYFIKIFTSRIILFKYEVKYYFIIIDLYKIYIYIYIY